MDSIDIDWNAAEADVRRSTHRHCPDCDASRGRYCDVHRCAAVSSSTGNRCKRGITAGDNPMYCASHACSARWVIDGTERVTCSSQGTMRDLPDGSRAMICDQHHALLQEQARNAADA
jgi:hypothetical protein